MGGGNVHWETQGHLELATGGTTTVNGALSVENSSPCLKPVLLLQTPKSVSHSANFRALRGFRETRQYCSSGHTVRSFVRCGPIFARPCICISFSFYPTQSTPQSSNWWSKSSFSSLSEIHRGRTHEILAILDYRKVSASVGRGKWRVVLSMSVSNCWVSGR